MRTLLEKLLFLCEGGGIEDYGTVRSGFLDMVVQIVDNILGSGWKKEKDIGKSSQSMVWDRQGEAKESTHIKDKIVKIFDKKFGEHVIDRNGTYIWLLPGGKHEVLLYRASDSFVYLTVRKAKTSYGYWKTAIPGKTITGKKYIQKLRAGLKDSGYHLYSIFSDLRSGGRRRYKFAIRKRQTEDVPATPEELKAIDDFVGRVLPGEVKHKKDTKHFVSFHEPLIVDGSEYTWIYDPRKLGEKSVVGEGD